MKLVLLKGSITIAATVALSACAAATMNSHKGAVIDPLLASSIQPGVDNKASVEKLLGRQRSFFEELFGNIGTVGSAGLPGSKQ